MLLGGNLSIVATEKFENLNEALSFVFGLHNIYQIFTPNEYRLLKDKSLITNEEKITIDGVFITFQNNCYDEFYPALDYFENKFNNEAAINLSKKAEQLDKIIHFNIRTMNNLDLKLTLYLTLAITALSNGIINSISFTHFSEFNAQRNFHTAKEWFEILSNIYKS